MKKITFLIIFLCCWCNSIYSQELKRDEISQIYHSEYFDCRDHIYRADNRETTTLYEKGNTTSPIYNFELQIQERWEKISEDIDRIVALEYPYLSLNEYKKSKKDRNRSLIIPLFLACNTEGKILFYRFFLEKSFLRDNPALERHLYNVISALKEKFVEYKLPLVNYNTGEKPTESSVGHIVVPLRMLKDN